MDADTPPPTAPLRVGIIGTGGVAHLHAAALRERDDALLVAAIDRDPDRARDFADRYGIPTWGASFDDLPAVDVLHLCTPPGVHAEQAEAGFALGSHVVVEKPPALSLAEVDRMTAAADRAGRRLAVVFQQRTGSAAAHVRGLLRSGALGRPLVARCDTLWYRDADYFDVPWRGRWDTEGGGTTTGHGIHQLDLLAHLLGDVDEVSGQAWRVGREIETEDVSTAVLRFASGVVAVALTSAVSPRQASAIRIDTERATIELEHLYGHGHAHWRLTAAPHVPAEEAASWAFPDAETPSGHAAYLDAVYPALASGAPLPEVCAAPARSLEIVAAIYHSSRRGAPVAIRELRDVPAMRAAVRADVVDVRPGRRP